MTNGLAACAVSAIIIGGPPLFAKAPEYSNIFAGQDKGKDKPVQVSEGEQAALNKVKSAPDSAAKVAAATEFVKKYPKSTQRAVVSDFVAGEVGKEPDAAKRVTQLESLAAAFNQPADADIIDPFLAYAYIQASRADDAFRVAAGDLGRKPDDITVLTQMTLFGIEQAKKGNQKFVQQSQQYGAKAIELYEQDKKPAKMDDATWQDGKKKWLPQLYQSVGFVEMATGNKDGAVAKLQKAVSLNPSDPFNYVLLGSIVDEEYRKLAEQFKTMSAGPLKDETLKAAQGKMDEVVDFFAHAVALSEGVAQYEKLHDQILSDLQTYYKYRHNNTLDGLQQLLDKYKKQ